MKAVLTRILRVLVDDRLYGGVAELTVQYFCLSDSELIEDDLTDSDS